MGESARSKVHTQAQGRVSNKPWPVISLVPPCPAFWVQVEVEGRGSVRVWFSVVFALIFDFNFKFVFGLCVMLL